jgi:hypothetical protein
MDNSKKKASDYIKLGFKWILAIIVVVLVKDPIAKFVVNISNDVPWLRQIVDFPSVRIEPRAFNFEGPNGQIQKSFKFICVQIKPSFDDENIVLRHGFNVSSQGALLATKRSFFRRE